MGRVYRAEDPVLRREVALKVMTQTAAVQPGEGAFLREARAAGRPCSTTTSSRSTRRRGRRCAVLAMPLAGRGNPGSPLKRETAACRGPRRYASARDSRGLAAPTPRGSSTRHIKAAQPVAGATRHRAADRQGAMGPNRSPTVAAPNERVKVLDFAWARAAAGNAPMTRTGEVVARRPTCRPSRWRFVGGRSQRPVQPGLRALPHGDRGGAVPGQHPDGVLISVAAERPAAAVRAAAGTCRQRLDQPARAVADAGRVLGEQAHHQVPTGPAARPAAARTAGGGSSAATEIAPPSGVAPERPPPRSPCVRHAAS